MKSIIFLSALVIMSVLATSCCSQPFKDWSKADSVRQVSYTTLHVTDWLQTRQGICGSDDFRELNPVLGPDPSKTEVDIWMGSTLILQTMMAGWLKPEYRPLWQYMWIGAEASTVAHNHRLGVRISF